MSTTDDPVKCVGIWGRIFGHRFRDRDYTFGWCQRCGMPAGGWRQA
jgi:hypothetical protein